MNEFVPVRKIGEGSFGKALLMIGKRNGRHYVIKEINISKMASKEKADSRKEVKVLSKMKHPNIVSYFKSFEEAGNLYIVMEFCDGGDLYKKINNQRGVYFTEDQVLDWFVQIALALKHVHDRKILHRDIKTQNIFLTKSNTIKLGDFGIARVLRNTMELARTCIGTPYYISPEICESRPYNNKSDVWSLGCVLYEMLTLKHAFEAGNMKNLVWKIIRGSYPPVPPRYSSDVRLLVAQLFKRNPHDRPSINTVLKKPFIHVRIEKFLPNEVVADEFSHTVLHRQPFEIPVVKAAPKRYQNKPQAAPKKYSNPAAKYGVSVANKPAKKPSNDVNARKILKPADREEKAKESDAREKRRQRLLKEQEDAYNNYMKSVQQQRWQKQQMEKINKAKEQNWKNSGNILSPEKVDKKSDNCGEPGIVNKEAAQMKKYQNAGKENRPHLAYEADRRPPPMPAWQAVRQGEENRARGAEAAERARVLEEFWQRKREAMANKNRGGVHVAGQYPAAQQANGLGAARGPNVQGERDGALFGENKSRNPKEKDYLARLEAIRKQNYRERLEIQQRVANVRDPVSKPPSCGENGDPRVDPAARRKKIAALKAQAVERAAMLRGQMEARRKEVLDRVEAKAKEQRQVKPDRPRYQRPVSAHERSVDERPAVPAVGLETALKQVGATRLFRSRSEGDLSKVLEENADEKSEPSEVQRKQWGGKPFTPLMLPLEVTASGMEATSVNDVVLKPDPDVVLANKARQKWDRGQNMDVVSALEKADICPATIGKATETLQAENTQANDLSTKNVTEVKKPISWVAGRSGNSALGVTVSISKADKVETSPSSPGTSSKLRVTVVKASSSQSKRTSSDEIPSTGRPLPLPPSPESKAVSGPTSPPPENNAALQQEKRHSLLETIDVDKEQQTLSGSAVDKPAAPIKAWEEKSSIATGQPAKENLVDSRKSYQEFLHSIRPKEGIKSPEEKEQIPIVHDEAKSKTCEESVNEDEDTSNDEEQSFYKTAENLQSPAIGLHTGQYDTDVKRLRTCSLPDLRLLFHTVPPSDKIKLSGELSTKANEENFSDGEEDDELEEEVDIDIACEESDEDNQDYYSMLASMEDVLVSEARSPSPIKAVRNLEDTCKSDDDDSDTNDDDDSQSPSPLTLNEDWDSGDSEDEDSSAKQSEDKESVFTRLEESRKMLEDELGFDRFMRVYKYIQSIQDNEDDVDIGVDPAPEISELLGSQHEHLYPKILYLVMADSAYCEDND